MSDTSCSTAPGPREGTGSALDRERLLRALLDAPFPTFVYADDGELLAVSRAFTEKCGYSAADAATLHDLAERLGIGEERLELEQAHAESSFEHGELSIRTKAGDQRIWGLCSRPIGRLPDGRRAVVASAVDLTARKRAENGREALLEETQRARAAAEAAERRIAFVYDVTAALLEGPLEVRGRLEKLARVLVPHIADCCTINVLEGDEFEIVAAAHWGPSCAASNWVGRRIPVRSDVAYGVSRVLLTGEPECVSDIASIPPPVPPIVAALREIGARSYQIVPLQLRGRRLGAVLMSFGESGRRYGKTELDLATDLCARAALAIENARLVEEARRAMQGREELLAIVSHDLKNPLSSVLLNASLIERRLPPDDDRGHKQAEVIQRSAEIMRSLIDRLLDVAQIETGNLTVEPTPCDAAPLLEEALDVMRPIAAAKSITLELHVAEGAERVEADRERLGQVLSNLVGNAIKFTDKGGRVAVRVDRAGDRVRIGVSDDGPGIAADDVEHVFDRFWQASKNHRIGAGLGLYIVKGIVEAHGGSIWIESEPGCGTTFYFTLRAAAPAEQPSVH